MSNKNSKYLGKYNRLVFLSPSKYVAQLRAKTTTLSGGIFNIPEVIHTGCSRGSWTHTGTSLPPWMLPEVPPSSKLLMPGSPCVPSTQPGIERPLCLSEKGVWLGSLHFAGFFTGLQ